MSSLNTEKKVLPAFRTPLSARIVVEAIADKQVFNVNDTVRKMV